MLRRNAWSIVRDGEFGHVAARVQTHQHPAVGLARNGVQGVHDEIGEDVLQRVGPGAHLRQAGRAHQLQAQGVGAAARPQHGHGGLGHGGQIAGAALRGPGSGEVEQVAHNAPGLVRVADDDGKVVLRLLLTLGGLQQLRIAADDAQGVVDLVRKPRRELPHGDDAFVAAHLALHAGREIGLAINALEVSAFRSSLANLIQIRLAERGWRAIPFFCMEPTLSGKLELSAFPGLRRTIEQKGIEALVTLGDFSESSLKFFRTKKLPVVFVGSLETDSARVVIDMPGFLHAAMAELRKGGCRHPGILISEALKPRLAPEFAAAGGAPELLFTGNYVADGAAAARLIQALPETARPDGMVIFDDTLASSFAAELYRQRAKQRPRLAILRNRQNPMDFADDNPLLFEVDLNNLADMAAKLLQQEFNGNPATGELKYTPKTR